jgi:hypothetical protein
MCASCPPRRVLACTNRTGYTVIGATCSVRRARIDNEYANSRQRSAISVALLRGDGRGKASGENAGLARASLTADR